MTSCAPSSRNGKDSPFRTEPGTAAPGGQLAVDHLSVVQGQFAELVGFINRAYSCRLTPPAFQSLSEVKEFCSGLLDPTKKDVHPWAPCFSHLKSRERMSIFGTLFLFRKVVPSLDKPSLAEYAERMSQPSVPVPSGYLEHVYRSVDAMFPPGWDEGYARFVRAATVPVSACLERSRMKGGARGVLVHGLPCGGSWLDRESFCRSVMDRNSRLRWKTDEVKLCVARCDGKQRIVSKNSIDMQALMPLHEVVYDHLSKKEWMLRGEALEGRFGSTFRRTAGEVFVSGDYESATDNLSLEVAQAAFSVMSMNARVIPDHILSAGFDSLRCRIRWDGGSVLQRRGQLMGNALSFPLLCLQNYLAFKFFVRRRVPVRINGDDIVFRAKPEEVDAWFDGVGRCGLKVSKGKTMVDPIFFSLNSTFFRSTFERVRHVPVVRSTMLFKPVDTAESIASRASLGDRFDPKRRDLLRSMFLRFHKRTIWATQRSLRRGLAVRVGESVLRNTGLYRREVFYGSLPEERPLPRIKQGWWDVTVPAGWRRVRSSAPVDESVQLEFRKKLVEAAWSPSEAAGSGADYWTSVKEHTPRYVCNQTLRKKAWRWLMGPAQRGARDKRESWGYLQMKEWMERQDTLPSENKKGGVPRWVYDPPTTELSQDGPIFDVDVLIRDFGYHLFM